MNKIDFFRYKCQRPYEDLPLYLKMKLKQDMKHIIAYLDILFYFFRIHLCERQTLNIPNLGKFYKVHFPKTGPVIRFRKSDNFGLYLHKPYLYCKDLHWVLGKVKKCFSLTQYEIGKIFNLTANCLKYHLHEHGVIKLRDFGFFYAFKYSRLNHLSTIDATIEQIRFKPSTQLRKQLNGYSVTPIKRVERLLKCSQFPWFGYRE